MTFDLGGFNRESSGNNGNSFIKYDYRTDDSQAEVGSSDYFRQLNGALKVNDIIQSFSTTDPQSLAYRSYRVVSVAPTVEIQPLQGGDTFTHIDIPMSSAFFDTSFGINTYATIPASLDPSRSFRLKGVRWSYTGDIAPNPQIQIGLTLDADFVTGMNITPTLGKDTAVEFSFVPDYFLSVGSNLFTSIIIGAAAPQLNYANVRVFLEEV